MTGSMSDISVFGLGYVGCVSAACFAKQGHSVVGVDVSDAKVDLVNAGKPTILEEGIAELVAEMRAAGRLRPRRRWRKRSGRRTSA